jgi:protein O-GlcNAc transferase
MSAAALARNAPCPCGSGKRYKDCHGGVGDAPQQPVSADSLLREAQVAFALGQTAVAHALLGRAVALGPERADLLRERARVEMALGDIATAETSCRAALDRTPDDVTAWNLLGEILHRTDTVAAEAAWRQALVLDPENAEASFHVGNCERHRGAIAAAITHYERALKRAPEHTGVRNNLGLALTSQGEVGRAEACYRDLLAIDSRHADALANLATLLHDQKRHREAVAMYERAVATGRKFPITFWIQRAVALTETGAIPLAEASLREAARLDPDHMPTQVDIGSLCFLQQNYEAAEAGFERGLELDPDNAYAAAMATFCRLQRCRWDGLESRFAMLRGWLEDDAPPVRYNIVPFTLLALPFSPRLQLNAARRWAQDQAARAGPVPARPARSRATGGQLRVGYLSSDFREHPIAALLAEVWERHDRTRLTTYAYSIGPREVSPQRARIEAAFDRFVDCSDDTIEQTARRIGEDGIEVLLDLNGYTTYAKSEILALRPAPVQINWLGYLGTLGAPWYDYVLTDRFAAPPELQPFFTEHFLYLPDCYCPSDTKRPVAARVPERAACGLPEQGLVFCCFNSSYKILPAVFDVWMRLLQQVPGSVLWLAPGNATARASLQREAAARGTAPERLVFAPRVSLPEHLARHAHADLFLDTTPYNAGTTANDALFMGVPVLTCAGATMVSRVAGSQLHAIGLPELVTTSLADYEALALALAGEPARLQACRQRLAAHRATYPLFDMERFTRALDDLLLAAWENRRSPAPS